MGPSRQALTTADEIVSHAIAHNSKPSSPKREPPCAIDVTLLLMESTGAGQPVSGDEIRNVRFVRAAGYDASQVDHLLDRIAAELDAETISRYRPGGPAHILPGVSAPNAPEGQAPKKDPHKRQLLETGTPILYAGGPLGQSQDNVPEPDAYRLPSQDWPAEGRTYLRTRTSRRALQVRFAEECWKAWNEFGQQPGTYLRLEWVKIARRELRSAGQQALASVTYRWYDPILGNANISEIGGQFFINNESFVLKSTGYAQSRKLVDKTGTPILYTSGMNFERRAKARVSFPDGRSLRFPVRGTHRANAIMTAVDEAANSVARYRIIRFSTGGSGRKSVEIAVHPDFELTNELMLAIMTSAPQLRSYFSVQSGGG